MNILTVVFEKDLGNLLYQAYSLKKNWLGEKRWIVIVEDKIETKQFIENRIVPIMKLDGWEIVVQMAPNMNLSAGWWRQQVCKLWAASEICNSAYSLILDAKNFLINPINETFFFNNGNLKVRLWSDEKFGMQGCGHDRNWSEWCQFFGKDPTKLTETWVTTPWVWQKELVKLTIKEFLIRGVDIYTHGIRLPVWEFDAYWIVSQEHLSHEDADFGEAIWWHTDRIEMIRDRYKILPFWTFHRRALSNPELVNFSNNILLEMGIINDDLIKEYAQLCG